MLVKASEVRKAAKEYGKQVSEEFLERLDVIIRERVRKACLSLPGGVKRLKAIDLM